MESSWEILSVEIQYLLFKFVLPEDLEQDRRPKYYFRHRLSLLLQGLYLNFPSFEDAYQARLKSSKIPCAFSENRRCLMKNKILWAGRSGKSSGNKRTSNKKKLHRFVSLKDLSPESKDDIKRRERAFQLQFDLKDIRIVGEAFIHDGYYTQVIEEGKGWCTCEDFRYRTAPREKPCKHIIGLKFALDKVSKRLIKDCHVSVKISAEPVGWK